MNVNAIANTSGAQYEESENRRESRNFGFGNMNSQSNMKSRVGSTEPRVSETSKNSPNFETPEGRESIGPPNLVQYQLDPNSGELEKWNSLKGAFMQFLATKNGDSRQLSESGSHVQTSEGLHNNDFGGNLNRMDTLDSQSYPGKHRQTFGIQFPGTTSDLDKDKGLMDMDIMKSMHLGRDSIAINNDLGPHTEGLMTSNAETSFKIARRKIEQLETIKLMESAQSVNKMKDQLKISEKENEDLRSTIANLQKIMDSQSNKSQENETKLLEELKVLKEYNAKYSEDRFGRMEREIIKLKEDLAQEKKLRIDMEEQYKQENQDLMHLYIDAEETKKHILEQLIEIKQSKEIITREKKIIEQERMEAQRLKEGIMRQSIASEVHKSLLNEMQGSNLLVSNVPTTFMNSEFVAAGYNPGAFRIPSSQDDHQSHGNYKENHEQLPRGNNNYFGDNFLTHSFGGDRSQEKMAHTSYEYGSSPDGRASSRIDLRGTPTEEMLKYYENKSREPALTEQELGYENEEETPSYNKRNYADNGKVTPFKGESPLNAESPFGNDNYLESILNKIRGGAQKEDVSMWNGDTATRSRAPDVSKPMDIDELSRTAFPGFREAQKPSLSNGGYPRNEDLESEINSKLQQLNSESPTNIFGADEEGSSLLRIRNMLQNLQSTE